MPSFFTNKGVSDPLIKASSDILNFVSKYIPGDNVVVKEGPNAGMDGMIVGSRSAGYSDIQLTRGRQITISNDFIAGSSGMLNESKKDDEEEDNNGKSLDFKGKKKKKKKSKKDFFKKDDDDDDDSDENKDDDDSDENKDDDSGEEDGVPKKAKKKSKAGGKGEEIEINPKLGEQIQDLNRQANIIQSGRAMAIMREFLSNR
jgi:hypothetical protein